MKKRIISSVILLLFPIITIGVFAQKKSELYFGGTGSISYAITQSQNGVFTSNSLSTLSFQILPELGIQLKASAYFGFGFGATYQRSSSNGDVTFGVLANGLIVYRKMFTDFIVKPFVQTSLLVGFGKKNSNSGADTFESNLMGNLGLSYAVTNKLQIIGSVNVFSLGYEKTGNINFFSTGIKNIGSLHFGVIRSF